MLALSVLSVWKYEYISSSIKTSAILFFWESQFV